MRLAAPCRRFPGHRLAWRFLSLIAVCLSVRALPFRLQDDEEAGVVSKADRDGVKTHLVSIMAQMPPSIQRQLCDALEHVSRYDWPHAWPALLPDLVKQLRAATDMRNVSGVLETADAVFMRFRDAYDSDDVKVVLKHALDTFAEPLTNTVKLLDGKVRTAYIIHSLSAVHVAHALVTTATGSLAAGGGGYARSC